jgi:hypothetical protein
MAPAQCRVLLVQVGPKILQSGERQFELAGDLGVFGG